jgi:hypothetical protein
MKAAREVIGAILTIALFVALLIFLARFLATIMPPY